MSTIDLTVVIGYLLERSLDSAIGGAKRREVVIQTLKKLRLNPDTPPTDFEGVYAYTLVEYGADKPPQLLNLFRQSIVREAFRRTFESNDSSIFNHETSEYLQSEEGKMMYQLEYDPLQELTKFQEVFLVLVNRARTIVEIIQNAKLDNIHDKVAALLTQLNLSQVASQQQSQATHEVTSVRATLSGSLIVDVSKIIGFPVNILETAFGEPTEIVWRRLGSAEDIPDGGETREYHYGQCFLDINYDKSGIAKGVRFHEGLHEYKYTLDDWMSILDRFGVTMVRLPDLLGITTRIWSNYLGYFIKVASRKVGGHVEAVRIYKIP